MDAVSIHDSPHPIWRLLERWEQDRSVLIAYGDERAATLLTQAATDVREAVLEWNEEVLGIRDAARESGYSPDRLRELVRLGEIPNAGRPNKPRVKRADLPKKGKARANRIARRPTREHNADALFLDIVQTKYGSAR